MTNDEEMEIVLRHYKNIPINVYSLARDLKLEIKELSEEEISNALKNLPKPHNGYLSYKDSAYTIYINESHTMQRKRFTIAHEIAHFIKHKEILVTKVIINDEEINNLEYLIARSGFGFLEREANEFAAELLMPKNTVMVKCIRKEFPNLRSIANHFQVSEQAMKIRIHQLGLDQLSED